MSNKPVVTTGAPIPLADLKMNFVGEGVRYLIDMDQNTMNPYVLITYLGNLEIDFNLKFHNYEQVMDMLDAYLNTPTLVKIPELLKPMLEMVKAHKNLESIFNKEDKCQKEFFESHKDILDVWVRRLDSLLVYAIYAVNSEDMRDGIKDIPNNMDNDPVGCNFVNLLSLPNLLSYYETVDDRNLEYYPHLFNDYMFKDKALFDFWVNDENTINHLVSGIAVGKVSYSRIKEALSGIKD